MYIHRLLILVLVALVGCDTKPPLNVPVEMTVAQRSTADVPGSAGKLRLEIDDITGGQVEVSLVDAEGHVLLPTTSLRTRQAAAFELEGEQYELTLKKLDNALIGEDFATFVISTPGSGGVSEAQRIERLLAGVAAAEGVVFIRSDVEYTPPQAAEHLRSKWRAAGNKVATVDEFIEHIGSKSSVSGEPYRVRLPDGTEHTAGDWLRAKLAESERAVLAD
jgi:hypothetical protein